jgi:hypothetical protein
MAKRTWRWVTRDATINGVVCIWRCLDKPALPSSGTWESTDKITIVEGASNIAYGHWLEVFGVPLKRGEIKKVRFTCEVL